ncbi:MAG: class I SAM-dependent methyltransferase [Elusimicrobiota bacterium]
MTTRALLSLARRVFRAQGVQPATALWRVFETQVVLERLCGRGKGLDLGCGDGRLAEILFCKTPDIRWTGLDLDAEDAARARARGLYEKVHAASASAIPEPDGSFDVVFSNSALEHMDGLDAVLTEAARVLKPGGRFFFTVPVPEFRNLLLWPRLLRRTGFAGAAERYAQSLDRRLAHVNYLSKENWEDRLARRGLRLETAKGYFPGRGVAVWETLSNATGGLLYWLGGGRRTPRQIQESAGLLRRERPWLGDAMLAVSFPALLLADMDRSKNFGCLFAAAVKTS